MAEHRLTNFTATIAWLGSVPHDPENIRSAARDALPLTYAGVPGENHEGLTRAACVRVTNRHPEGTEIANTRQLSILSAEEMAEIAAEIGLDTLDPEHLGATLVLTGIPDFTHVPPASRLQGPDGVCIVIDVENGPCNFPAREIEKDEPGHGKAFKAAARGKRGVTAWVEREGALKVGDELRLFVPDQRGWAGE
jgi:MOSC domain-containing protein YiiM